MSPVRKSSILSPTSGYKQTEPRSEHLLTPISTIYNIKLSTFHRCVLPFNRVPHRLPLQCTHSNVPNTHLPLQHQLDGLRMPRLPQKRLESRLDSVPYPIRNRGPAPRAERERPRGRLHWRPVPDRSREARCHSSRVDGAIRFINQTACLAQKK